MSVTPEAHVGALEEMLAGVRDAHAKLAGGDAAAASDAAREAGVALTDWVADERRAAASNGTEPQTERVRIYSNAEDLLAALLLAGAYGLELSGRTLADVRAEGITAGSFERECDRLIFAAVETVVDRGEPSLYNAVEAELAQAKQLAAAGGKVYLVDLAKSAPAVENARHYARLVGQEARTRADERLALRMLEAARNGGVGDALRGELAAQLKQAPASSIRGSVWLIDAAELLAEPDPGPTRYLIEHLMVERAIVACVGRWKTTKSYGMADLSISIATGEPAFGALAIAEPGPVIFVNEESGRDALWRRLDALCRGRAIDPERLRGRLHVAANARAKLDDPGWQQELIARGREIRPLLFVFDPLARMKAAKLDENEQTAMAVLIEFVRQLRDETGASVAFVHHTGHAGGHMRGSSDLESAWETRLTWTRDGQSPLVTLASEHREAEPGDPISYRIAWDHETRSMRFPIVQAEGLPPLEQRIVEWLRQHPNQKAQEVAKGLEIRASDVRETLARLEQAGTTHNGASGRADAMGRAIRDKVWNLAETQAPTLDVACPDDGTTQDKPPAGHRGSVARPVSLETGGTDEPPDEPSAHDEELAWR